MGKASDMTIRAPTDEQYCKAHTSPTLEAVATLGQHYIVVGSLSHTMNRSVATLELYDTSWASTGMPLLRLQMPVLTRGASVVSFQLAYNPHACVHDDRSPFHVDPSATIIVALLRVMAPSAEGTGTETVMFIMPVSRLERLIKHHAAAGASLTWIEWGPASTRVLSVSNFDSVPDWVLRSSIDGLNFAFATYKTVSVYTMNQAIACDMNPMEGWSMVDAPVDSWAFEDIIRSNLSCWRCSTRVPRVLLAPTLCSALLEENHLFVITQVCLPALTRKEFEMQTTCHQDIAGPLYYMLTIAPRLSE